MDRGNGHGQDHPNAASSQPQAFQASRIRDAFIASDIEQGVCRTLISVFLPTLTTRPLKPGEGRVWKLEQEKAIS